MDLQQAREYAAALLEEEYLREAAEKAATKEKRAAERKRQRAAGQRERNKTAQAAYRARYRDDLRAARSVATALMGLRTGSNPAHTNVFSTSGELISAVNWVAGRLRAFLTTTELVELRRLLDGEKAVKSTGKPKRDTQRMRRAGQRVSPTGSGTRQST